ncbi:MAG: molecular chaperone HtpG, partial [Spirochaetes bacterium]|nr:molecular chaperone HtpG [Spirochaetota bacterium]
EGYTGFAEYKDRMKPEQKTIYYITGENEQNLKNSPLLEAYKIKDIEVLIMDDDIDEIVTPSIGKYRDIELISVNRSDAADELKTDEDKESEKKIEPLIKKIKKVLGNDVKDVRASTRLSDSPSCIVADEKDPTIQMQHLLRSMGQSDIPEIKPVLEINPGHEIVRKLVNTENSETIEDVSRLLLEQALLLEGAELEDPSSFVKRLNRVLTRSL